jgi:phosphatidylinositol kinase/protein kinase (PI-3  family)
MRVRQKLTGKDFNQGVELSIGDHAQRLIGMATDTYDLARMYSGW